MTVRVLSFGAGVQSSTLLRMAIAGDIEPVDHAVFADTGWEPKAVYEHMKQMRTLAESAGIQFHVVSNGNIKDDLFNPDARFASMPVHVTSLTDSHAKARRQCTDVYKLRPVLAKQRELAGLEPWQRSKEHLVTTLIGISLDEVHRMKPPAFPWIRNEYPLVDLRMTRHDCLLWHRKQQLPAPPRSACIGCPYHSNKEWRHMKDNDPESWADAVEVDEQIRSHPVASERMYQGRAYLHKQRIPLSVADLSNEEDHGQLSMFGEECEGMCGL